ncbi:hypothetical protein FCH28_15490 [Streptomyces piniterrae]|uniref:Uncharacterized protein n=1 Tax=Streptomyces piniterrae TaxID=2571125 RepID=A0A4U0NWD0_9ACTN|nr:hypothetical protein [Streptomyces piniterrae]TJZ54514.1 hypothetical protein FCH28_15490 [Streptomyces piniterrae]
MRMVLKAQIPVEAGNEAIRNGTMSKVIESALESIKPEAAYFTTDDGYRTAFLYFDMQDSSQMPVVAESFFLDMNANVTIKPVMNTDDLRKGLKAMQGGI